MSNGFLFVIESCPRGVGNAYGVGVASLLERVCFKGSRTASEKEGELKEQLMELSSLDRVVGLRMSVQLSLPVLEHDLRMIYKF